MVKPVTSCRERKQLLLITGIGQNSNASIRDSLQQSQHKVDQMLGVDRSLVTMFLLLGNKENTCSERPECECIRAVFCSVALVTEPALSQVRHSV